MKCPSLACSSLTAHVMFPAWCTHFAGKFAKAFLLLFCYFGTSQDALTTYVNFIYSNIKFVCSQKYMCMQYCWTHPLLEPLYCMCCVACAFCVRILGCLHCELKMHMQYSTCTSQTTVSVVVQDVQIEIKENDIKMSFIFVLAVPCVTTVLF